jgi:hypothetical protein
MFGSLQLLACSSPSASSGYENQNNRRRDRASVRLGDLSDSDSPDWVQLDCRMLLARLPCRKSQEASLSLANLLGFYLAIWLMRVPFLPSILLS